MCITNTAGATIKIYIQYSNVVTINKNDTTTKFRGLEPTNPQWKTSKQLINKSLEEKTQYIYTAA